jgi:hypothetical protein
MSGVWLKGNARGDNSGTGADSLHARIHPAFTG